MIRCMSTPSVASPNLHPFVLKLISHNMANIRQPYHVYKFYVANSQLYITFTATVV